MIVERNHDYWADQVDKMPPVTTGAQRIERIRFQVVPDTITSALELKKGSADLASNVVTLDMVHTLEAEPNLKVESGAGVACGLCNIQRYRSAVEGQEGTAGGGLCD